MRKTKDGTTELDGEDIVAIEEAIVFLFHFLCKKNEPKSSDKMERLKRIYQRMMCARVFIK